MRYYNLERLYSYTNEVSLLDFEKYFIRQRKSGVEAAMKELNQQHVSAATKRSAEVYVFLKSVWLY